MKSNAIYNPNRWVILKINSDLETIYKVFGMQSGGYLDADNWQCNSGITKFEEDDTHYYFHGLSGSIYKCHKEMYGCSVYGASVIDGFQNHNLKVLNEDEWKSELTYHTHPNYPLTMGKFRRFTTRHL